MWQYLPGVSKPEKKQHTPEQVKAYYKSYDAKRVRRSINFAKWQVNRPLLVESEGPGLICIVCVQYGTDRTSVFVKGCKSNKLESVKKHETSKQHVKNQLVAVAKSKAPEESVSGKIIQKLNSEIIQKLDKCSEIAMPLCWKTGPSQTLFGCASWTTWKV